MDCHDIVELSPLYLSGELDASRAAAFADHLKTCPACAHEIAQELDIDAYLREEVLASEAEVEMANAALDRRIRQRIVAERRSATTRWVLAAGIAAILLIGGLVFRMWPTEGPERACNDAANDHRNEIVLQHPRSWTRDQPAIQALAGRLSLPPAAIPTFATTGYHLDRAKLCRLDGRVYLHLVYSNGTAEFSFFLRPNEGKTPADAYTAAVDQEHVALVTSRTMTAMVVTEQPGDTALSLARSLTGTL